MEDKSSVTQYNLRVNAVINGLKDMESGDVFDALLPFFEPILGVLNGQIFDSRQIAKGLHNLYGWNLYPDIVEKFVGKLKAKHYLSEHSHGVYIITYSDSVQLCDLVVNHTIDILWGEFDEFRKTLSDLFAATMIKSEFIEGLVAFLVSLNVYSHDDMILKISKINSKNEILAPIDQLAVGGPPSDATSRYLFARFVRTLTKTNSQLIPFLAKIASVGLIADVIREFTIPTKADSKVDAEIILDGPIALELIGLSGKAIKSELDDVFGSLRAIGCTISVLATTCEEMTRSLSTLLNTDRRDRYGPTHTAMIQGEVHEDYVRSVSNDPRRALGLVGVNVREDGIAKMPAQNPFFSSQEYKDFEAGIPWKLESYQARQHDAECMALTMYLRSGFKSSDILQSKFVFVTRNAAFVRYTREYLSRIRKSSPNNIKPVHSYRDLATAAWLRTGLKGSNDERRRNIPISSLLASCERILQPRREVIETVRRRIARFSPDLVNQYELFLQDERSIQRLMDETLGMEVLANTENPEQLLDSMKRAAAADLESKHRAEVRRIRTEGERMRIEAEKVASALNAEVKARDEELRIARGDKYRSEEKIRGALSAIVLHINAKLRRVSYASTVGIFLVLVAAVLYDKNVYDKPYLLVLFIVSLTANMYYLIQDIRGRSKLGLRDVLRWLARRWKEKELNRLNLADFSAMIVYNEQESTYFLDWSEREVRSEEH